MRLTCGCFDVKFTAGCQHCYCRNKILFDRVVEYCECCWCGDLKPYKEVKGVPA